MGDEKPFGKRTPFSGKFIPPVPEFEAPWGEGPRPTEAGYVAINSVMGVPKVPVAPLASVLRIPSLTDEARLRVENAYNNEPPRPSSER